MSRTHQYRKVMKPLLERKRRARINKCLDELKDIMVNALQAEGESIAKLEKADVLELTVKHLRKLKHKNALGLTPQATYAGKFKSGYKVCAQEVSNFITVQSESNRTLVDDRVSAQLLSHLGGCIRNLDSVAPSEILPSPPSSWHSPAGARQPGFASEGPPVSSYGSRHESIDILTPHSESDNEEEIDVETDVALDLSPGSAASGRSGSYQTSKERQHSQDSEDSGNGSLCRDRPASFVRESEGSWRPW